MTHDPTRDSAPPAHDEGPGLPEAESARSVDPTEPAAAAGAEAVEAEALRPESPTDAPVASPGADAAPTEDPGEPAPAAAATPSRARASLERLRQAQEAGVPVPGRITNAFASGFMVDLSGVRGFCPLSHADEELRANPSGCVGRALDFIVISVGQGRGKVVLSRRRLLRDQERERERGAVRSLHAGDERDGTVKRLEPYGAFIDVGGVVGLAHVTELSHARIGHPSEVVKPGDRVHVKVLTAGPDPSGRFRLALSLKAAAPDPWDGVESRITVGATVHGSVVRVVEFGVFVAVEPGIVGLVPVSHVGLHRVAHPRDVLKVGQEVDAVVVGLETGRKRLSLSIRDALAAKLPPPREPAVGEIVEGRVGSVQPYGVFVDLPELGARASGLMPLEESGQPRGTDLKLHFKVGAPVRVEILESREGRLRLRLEGATPIAREPRPDGAPRAERPAGGSAAGERRGRPGRGTAERGAGPPRGERAAGSERAGRGGRGERERPARREAPSVRASAPARNEPQELTTMALALRKAMEEARRKQEGGDPA